MLASHRGVLDSIPGQLQRTNWHWDSLFCEYFCVPLSVLFLQYSIFILILIHLLLLLEGQAGVVFEPFADIREQWTQKYFHTGSLIP